MAYPQAAVEQYRLQQAYVALALAQVAHSWRTKRFGGLVALLVALQREVARAAFRSVQEMVDEQGIDAPLEGRPVAEAFMGYSAAGAELQNLVEAAESAGGLQQLIITELADVQRVAQGVSTVARPTLQGHVRYLNPPSCGRCAVLAGRFYRWSDGFQRHPNCDCFMVPTTLDVSDDWGMLTDPEVAYRRGEIKGLTKAERDAIDSGADIAQVINVRRKKAGLTVAGRVLERGGRITPEGIYALASNRQDAIEMLTSAGYIT